MFELKAKDISLEVASQREIYKKHCSGSIRVFMGASGRVLRSEPSYRLQRYGSRTANGIRVLPSAKQTLLLLARQKAVPCLQEELNEPRGNLLRAPSRLGSQHGSYHETLAR